jgi:hypothetical protein
MRAIVTLWAASFVTCMPNHSISFVEREPAAQPGGPPTL